MFFLHHSCNCSFWTGNKRPIVLCKITCCWMTCPTFRLWWGLWMSNSKAPRQLESEWIHSYLPLFNKKHPLKNAEPTCVPGSIYLCWGWFLICDLNTSAGEHLNVLQMCVYVLCVVEGMCVFLGSWLGEWNIHGGMVGLAAEQRAGWQGRAEHGVFWSSSPPPPPTPPFSLALSLSLSLSLFLCV